jgi:hypothetical protein
MCRISFGFIVSMVFVFGIAIETTNATLMPVLEVDSSQYTMEDFNPVHIGNELRIDYFAKNVSTFTDPGNAFKNIEISAGTNNGAYDAQLPDGWEVIFYENKTRFHTSNSSYYIYPSETEPTLFSLFYFNTTMTTGQSQAGTPLGLWSDSVSVNIAVVPEPSTIVLLSLGAFCFRKRKR